MYCALRLTRPLYIHRLYCIPSELMDLPSMGVPVKVAGLEPVDSDWHPRLNMWLDQLCAEKVLLVKIRVCDHVT